MFAETSFVILLFVVQHSHAVSYDDCDVKLNHDHTIGSGVKIDISLPHLPIGENYNYCIHIKIS